MLIASESQDSTWRSKASVFALITTVLSICISAQIFKTILPLWAFDKTKDASLIAASRFIEYIPLFIFFGVFGRLIDGLSSRSLLLIIALIMTATSALVFSPLNIPMPIILVLAGLFFAGFYLLHASRIVITRRVSSPEQLVWANRSVSVAAQAFVIAGPAIGAFAILVKDFLNPFWIIILFCVLGVCAALGLRDLDSSTPNNGAQPKANILSAIGFWRRNFTLSYTTLLTAVYNFIDAMLWFSFFYILKAELRLEDQAVAFGLLPGVLGCALGFYLSKVVSGKPREGFILSYSLLFCSMMPLLMMKPSVLSVGLTVFIISMSNIIHSFVLSEVRLRAIPRVIEGRVNSWITVVIRTGNLIALLLASFVYRDIALAHIHYLFMAVSILMVLISSFLYIDARLKNDLNHI